MTTAHGEVKTPMFMPVGTLASVKALDTEDVEETKAPIILANTYHLFLRPGMEVMKAVGGLHQFMRWPKPILTDSGGFQVFSLSNSAQKFAPKTNEKHPKLERSASVKHTSSIKITEEGVYFTSHLDGSRHFFTPEKAIQIQREIGADIIMAFDECTPDQADMKYTKEALTRTNDWAKKCYDYWQSCDRQSEYGHYQALFGIIQGAMHPELRREAAQFIVAQGFDGIALGGESIGYNKEATQQVMDWVRDILPEDKPRYAMGLGRDPDDIVTAVLAGYDMFDCVAPTRLARNGTLYFGELDFSGEKPTFVSPYPKGRLQIGNEQWKTDQKVIQPGCDCSTCQRGYSRGYLRHLFHTKELAYFNLASIHNVRFMIRLCEQLREWILTNSNSAPH